MLKKVLVIGIILAGSAQAETRRFFDAEGHPQGRSESQGKVTRFYDANGHLTGRAEVGSNGIVRHFDKDGHAQGETR